MLMKCPECELQVSDKAISCPPGGSKTESGKNRVVPMVGFFTIIIKNIYNIKHQHKTQTSRRSSAFRNHG